MLQRFPGFTYAVASTSWMLSTNKYYDEMNKLLTSYNDFDEYFSRSFEVPINHSKLMFRYKLGFVMFLLLSVSYAAFLFYFRRPYVHFAHTITFLLTNHIVMVGTIQIFIFIQGVNVRLKMIRDRIHLDNRSITLVKLQQCYASLVDINLQFNNCFKFPLMFNLMHCYVTLIIGFYLFGIYLIGVPFSTIYGEI